MKSIKNKGEEKFSDLLEQIERSVSQKLFYVAIMASLAIPDIGGAIDSNDGRACKKRYIGWFDEYAAPKYQSIGQQRLTGDECYYLRCSVLHQGTMQHEAIKKYSDIIFCEIPQASASVNSLFLTPSKILLVEPKIFCNNMIYAAYDWLEVIHNDKHFKENSKNFMTMYSLSFPESSEKKAPNAGST